MALWDNLSTRENPAFCGHSDLGHTLDAGLSLEQYAAWLWLQLDDE